MAVYTVPKGKQALMTNWWASITRDGTKAATADLVLMAVHYGMNQVYGERKAGNLGLNSLGSGYVQHSYTPYRAFEAQTDIYINVASVSDNNARIAAGFDLILIDDELAS